MATAEALVIRELESDAEIRAALPLMRFLRERLPADEEAFLQQVRAQEEESYRLIGGFAGAQLVTLAGVRRQQTTARGLHAFVDDLVTLPSEQGKGYATAMLRFIAARALEYGLSKVYLDSRASALSYYDKIGFRFLTSVPCWIDANKLVT
jgi:GNAT superfamily N-acetyltransferase